MTKFLVDRQIKALVIACNTATIASLTHLKTIFPELPILGVVLPGAAAAAAATKNQRIAVLATETTIATQAYDRHIIAEIPNAAIRSRACSLLVALAEEGMVDNSIAHTTLLHYLRELDVEDTILLGCTHFPVFKPALTRLLPQEIKIIDSAAATAQALLAMLSEAKLCADSDAHSQVQYLVTDSVSRFQRVGEIFLGEPLSFENIELVDPAKVTNATTLSVVGGA